MAINRYSGDGVEQTLEKYVPLPFQEMMMAGKAIQDRGDLAQQQVDQAQIGLASIAANPYHQDFINNYANQFKASATELLNKYQGNTSNPEFIRESKRLSMQFASDPRLKAIQQAKLEYDKKQTIKQELDAKGIKYVDTGASYKGYDPNGQISANVGTLRTTNYDKVIADRIAQAAKGMEQRGNLKSNQWNIAGTNQALKQQIFTDPELSMGVQHLMQQGGLSEAQAVKTMSDYIDNVSSSMVSSDIDHFAEEFAQRERFHRDQMNDNAADRAVRMAAARASAQTAQVPTNLGTYFVQKPGEREIANDHEIPIAGTSNVNFNKPFKGVLNGDRFVFHGGDWNGKVEKKTGSVTIKDGTFVNATVPYVITGIEGSNSKSYTAKKGQILSKDSGSWYEAGVGASSENIDIQRDPKTGRSFVYLDKDRKVKGYVQPQAFGVYKDNESGATIYKRLGRDEALTYLGPDAGKLSNDGYTPGAFNRLDANTKLALAKTAKERGEDLSTYSQERLDDIADRIQDQKYYNERIAPLFSNPGTTKSIQQYYLGTPD